MLQKELLCFPPHKPGTLSKLKPEPILILVWLLSLQISLHVCVQTKYLGHLIDIDALISLKHTRLPGLKSLPGGTVLGLRRSTTSAMVAPCFIQPQIFLITVGETAGLSC